MIASTILSSVASQDDVQGFAAPLIIGMFFAGYGSVRFGYDVTKAIIDANKQPEPNVIDISQVLN